MVAERQRPAGVGVARSQQPHRLSRRPEGAIEVSSYRTALIRASRGNSSWPREAASSLTRSRI